MTSFEARRKQLTERLSELSARLGRIEKHMQQPPNPDSEDRAQEAEMDEVLEGLGAAGTTEVDAIRAALTRLDDGTYGICLKCGGNISNERLDAVPYTPLCRDCSAAAGQGA